MASLRKKYSAEGPRQDGPPVSTPPVKAAEPPPAVEPKPIEQPQTESPADIAAKTALQQRLHEMEHAETLARQPQQQPHAAEPQQQQQPTLEEMIAHLPGRVQRWYRSNPEWLTNPEKAAQIQYVHHVARRSW